MREGQRTSDREKLQATGLGASLEASGKSKKASKTRM